MLRSRRYACGRCSRPLRLCLRSFSALLSSDYAPNSSFGSRLTSAIPGLRDSCAIQSLFVQPLQRFPLCNPLQGWHRTAYATSCCWSDLHCSDRRKSLARARSCASMRNARWLLPLAILDQNALARPNCSALTEDKRSRVRGLGPGRTAAQANELLLAAQLDTHATA